MGSNEAQIIASALQDYQEENRQQLSELRKSTTAMATAVADLNTTIARVEERHAHQDDGMKRIGKQLDDHENRLRKLEGSQAGARMAFLGGWKVLVTIGGVMSLVAAIASAAWPIISGP